MKCKDLIEKLVVEKELSHENWERLISLFDEDDAEYAGKTARQIADDVFGKKIFIRGLVEFSNVCRNDCFYCGIRKSNKNAQRYTLSSRQILECCAKGYEYGLRTFVLQSGEGSVKVTQLAETVSAIKNKYKDCAVTLSVGELTKDEYRALYNAGADRYLLRHETANEEHYRKLHPDSMSLSNRKKCLFDLKEIGFQTGCGFMVGSPCQSAFTLADDMLFISELKPEMVGIGPFIPHSDTPFADMAGGSVSLTLFLLSLLRIMLPRVLLPSTTALGTADTFGREKGILAGANVLMPNLSPVSVRDKYLLYDNKICTGDESAQCLSCLDGRMKKIGYEITVDRGDHPDFRKREEK